LEPEPIEGAIRWQKCLVLASHRVNPKLITQNWDDFLRVAGSLKMGKVSASELIRALQRGSKRSLLGRALGELGRIPKTLHLLTFIDDPCYRRSILTQLNRGEGRHRLARKSFHGQRGELRQRYREGQEDQLGALGLVVNALVLWNTRYMDADVEIFVNARFGYQVATQAVFEEGIVNIGEDGGPYVRAGGRWGGEITPSFLERFRSAYDAEVQSWVDAAKRDEVGGPTAWDGYATAACCEAGVTAQRSGERVKVTLKNKPGIYG
jgi:hypothetical protein